jgi:hypothetical protein
MVTRIKLRRDTAANWTATNPILAAGEPGLETDTGKIKYGDGVTAYDDLPHAGGDTLNDDGSISIVTGSTEHWVATQRRESEDTYNRAVRHDSLGNVYALSKTEYDDGDENIAVITKYSPTGSVLWQHTITDAIPLSLAVDSSDCAYISANYLSNVHLIKFNTDGTIAWKKSYDAGDTTNNAFIEERTSTRLILAATRAGTDRGVLVLDINITTGDIVTQKGIFNGSEQVFANGIDTDSDGNVFVTGGYYDTEDSKDKMFVEKLDTNLGRAWTKSLDTTTSYTMTAGDCASDAQGNVYAVGYFNIDVNNADDGNGTGTAGFLIKLNSSGVVQWTRRMGPGPCGNAVVGLTATDVGDVYLSTTTIEPSTNPQLSDQDKYAEGQVRMMVARFDTAGAVIWQRYIDDNHSWELADDFRGQAISVYGNKFVTDFYGPSGNNPRIFNSSTADSEADCFIVQLPTDGTDLEIGSLSFKASRIPGKFITQATTTTPTTVETFEGTVTVATSDLVLDTIDRIANTLTRSETYDYVFGADGTLTIPNDGDVKLTQSQIGWIGTVGGMENSYADIEAYAVATDSQGNMYIGGEENGGDKPWLAKFSPEGARLWSVRIEEDDDGYDGQVNGITIDPATGNVLAVCEIYGSYIYGAVVTIDPDTGRILSNTEYKDSDADVWLSELAFLSTGAWVAGGSKDGNFSPEQTATAVTGSTTQKLVVARSEIDGIPTNNWQIGGTGFSVFETIQNVEYYSGLTTTVRQGSGAVFDIINNGNGTYSASIVSGGTNYLAGHKIKILGTSLTGAENTTTYTEGVDWTGSNVRRGTNSIVVNSTETAIIAVLTTGTVLTNIDNLGETLTITGPGVEGDGDFVYPTTGTTSISEGTSLGEFTLGAGTYAAGATPANDIIITVDAVDAGVITSVSNTGTAAGTDSATASGVTGTNYNVGSGATFYYTKNTSDSNYNNYNSFGTVSGGSNYANDDVLTISGTQLGGTSPANDLVLRAYTGQAGLSPVQFPADPTGTAQTTNWNILTYTTVDFSQAGSWQLTFPLDRENILLTDNWQRTFGTNTGDYTDWTYAIAIDSGDNIIVVGEGFGIVTGQDTDTLATVYKFNSTGTLQWARKLNEANNDCYSKSVTTIGTDIYTTHYSSNDDETVITKLSANGTVQWQRRTATNNEYGSVIMPAGDGDLLVMTPDYHNDIDDDGIKIIKITTNGQTVYKRWFSAVTNDDTRLWYNGRCMSVHNGSFYIVGHYDTNQNDSTWLAKLPIDGSGTGEYGQFRYEGVDSETDNYDNYFTPTADNYYIYEVNLSSSYAGALAVEPYVVTTDQVLEGEGVYMINSFYENYYYQIVRDIGGGRIVFPDGTTQSTSAIDVPQNIYRGERYTLGMKDRGHHILCRETGDNIVIPYYSRVPFPVGSKIMIVNDSGSSVNIGIEGQSVTVLLSGSNGNSYSYFYVNYGDVATLLNIGRDRWVFFGDVYDN